MLLMDPLSEVHDFIIRVKRKTALERWSDKQGKRQKNVFRKILNVAANIPGNGMHVRNAIVNFFVKFRKSVEHWL